MLRDILILGRASVNQGSRPDIAHKQFNGLGSHPALKTSHEGLGSSPYCVCVRHCAVRVLVADGGARAGRLALAARRPFGAAPAGGITQWNGAARRRCVAAAAGMEDLL